jgi:hypothetical protein
MAWEKMSEIQMSPETIALLKRVMPEGGGEVKAFGNSTYQVFVRNVPPKGDWPEMVWLSIKRNDRDTIHDWRDLQRIKNDVVGEENEGVELYPAESRLVDTSNQYHMWVLKDPKLHFPFGFSGRFVTDQIVAETSDGPSKQRPLE